MKRSCLALITAILLVVSLSVFGQIKSEYWDQIPSAMKAHLTTTSYSGSRELSIMCFAVTEQTMQMLDSPEMQAVVEEALGGHCLMVSVAPIGSEYFWPTGFDFTQGYSQYEVGYGDFLPINDGFSGGELRSGTVAQGFIKIPNEIDTSRTFTIWYDDESASLGPIFFGGSAVGVTSVADLVVTFDRLPESIARGESAIIQVTTSPYANCEVILYTKDGVVESPDLSPQIASTDGKGAWIWQPNSQTPLGLVMLQVTASLEDERATVLGSFIVADQ